MSIFLMCMNLSVLSTHGELLQLSGIFHAALSFQIFYYPVNSSCFGLLELNSLSTQVVQINSVQSLSPVWLSATPWITAHQASLSITNSRSLLKLMSIELVMPSNHLILCRPLLLLPPIPPSIRVFSNESTLPMRWTKYWSFSFSISPFNEHPGLISLRRDWLDLPAVQGALKSLLQHHSSKASILWCSAFFTVQLSYPYMTTGKTIALTRQTFVGKVMSLLFNMLSRLVITFLLRSKHLNFMAAVRDYTLYLFLYHRMGTFSRQEAESIMEISSFFI